jgi:hypothetical protein
MKGGERDTYSDNINMCKVLVRKSDRKNPMEIPKFKLRIILKYIFKILWHFMDWIHLAEYGKQRRAVVNTVMNVRVP